MKPIVWNDKLSIDGGVIDNDHKFLIKIVNKFRERVGQFESSDEALEILEVLRSYSQQHFGREEKLQRVVSFPYRDAHHNSHITLIRQLDKLIEETRPTSGDYLNCEMGDKIGQFLHDWLIDHVVQSDLRMKPHVEEIRAHSQKMGELD